MGEYITKGTALFIRTHWNGTTPSTEPAYKSIYGVYTVPKIKGNRDTIDVTNLEDGAQRSILGLEQGGGAIRFSLYATKGEVDAESSPQIRNTKATLIGMEDEYCDFKVVYPDGYGYSWSGHVAVSEDETNVNEACKLSLDISIETALTRVEPDD